LQHRLQKLSQLSDTVALGEVQIFVNDVRKHHAEEEKVIFPLALRADALHEKRAESMNAAKGGEKPRS
jgi:hemerythrin-like domain-containing protein